MSENRQVLAATVVGAVSGGLGGYLFFTPRGRALRSQFEPALDDMMVELSQLRRTAVKASDVVGEGWKLLNQALREGTEQDSAVGQVRADEPVLAQAKIMEGNLGTTNLLLGIMAAVSVLEALLLIGAGVAGYLVYRRAMTLINEIETRQVAPAMARVNAILDDVKNVSTKVKDEAQRVDTALRTTMDRVDDTADRVRSNVKAQTGRLVGILRGARVAIETMLGARAM